MFSNNNSVPDVPYALHHREVSRVLNLSGNFISQNTDWKPSDIKEKDGRKASSIFETDFIKKFILDSNYSNPLNLELRRHTSDEQLKFLRFIDTSSEYSNGNAASREWADIGIIFMWNGKEFFVPVNIKYTSGKTADNICGWKAFAYLLFLDYGKYKNEQNIWDAVSRQEASWDAMRDYFVWSFKHGGETAKLFSSHSVFSLLGINPEQLTFNNSQPFPVQAKSFGLEADAKNMTISIADRKKRLAKWIASNRKKRAEELYNRLSRALAALSLE